ncbi:MAG: two-component sensor histidine kinase [Deltaproteobacteria bacterium]|nr:MAG: two-component sensor histidine kinase [Deltaproteobacteria bacterium]
MALFGRKLTLAEAVDRIRAELRAGTLPGDVVEELRRRDQPVVSGGREPPGLQEMLEAVPGAAALLEVGGRMVARNAGMTRLLGRAATVLEATRSSELQDVCARGLAGWPQRRELTLPALDLQVEAHVAPLTHARALLVLRDLTAERRADRVRRDFIANASHELRTPVTAIRAAAETLLDGGLELPDQAREFVRMISRHAARLSRLTDDLLDLSRLETGDWKPQTGPVQLAPLSDAVLELFRDAAGEKEIVLSADVPERLRANADRRALEQILVNLLDNAVKFTPKGGHVTLLGDGLGPAVMLSVVDTGPGIEPEHQPRIFERFYRADAGRSRELGGTGLGLAIVKHLAHAMGGEVGLESSANGSRFWLRLPSG